MQPTIGSKVKEKKARSWIPALQQLLYPGEGITALSRTNLLRPLADGLSVTTARVVAFSAVQVQAGKVAVQVLADNILDAISKASSLAGAASSSQHVMIVN